MAELGHILFGQNFQFITGWNVRVCTDQTEILWNKRMTISILLFSFTIMHIFFIYQGDCKIGTTGKTVFPFDMERFWKFQPKSFG